MRVHSATPGTGRGGDGGRRSTTKAQRTRRRAEVMRWPARSRAGVDRVTVADASHSSPMVARARYRHSIHEPAFGRRHRSCACGATVSTSWVSPCALRALGAFVVDLRPPLPPQPDRLAYHAPMSTQLFDLSGRIALVIGGTSGIGRTLAVGLAAAGADVVATGRREALVDEVAREIEGQGRRTLRVT